MTSSSAAGHETWGASRWVSRKDVYVGFYFFFSGGMDLLAFSFFYRQRGGGVGSSPGGGLYIHIILGVMYQLQV